MHISATVRDIWEGMRSQPGRVGLSFFSIAVGMAALTALLSVVGGIRRQVQVAIGELGVNVFGVVAAADAPPTPEDSPLRRRHVGYLAANLPGCRVTGLRLYGSEATGMDPGVVLVAADESLFQVRPWRVEAGRAFDRQDIDTRARVAVASASLARAMDATPGDSVRVRNIPFRLIGIADLGSGPLEAASTGRAVTPGERVLFVPWSVTPLWVLDENPPDQRVDAVFVRADDPSRFEDVVRRTRYLLAQPDYRVARESWITPRALVRQLRRLQGLMAVAGGSIALLCLLLGGTTLMSVLLADVQQRIPEIGLRRALGASRADIGVLFLAEACLVTVAASAAGMGLACLLFRVFAAWIAIPLVFSAPVFLIPLATGVALGALFSFWPAHTAAGISPAEALRNA